MSKRLWLLVLVAVCVSACGSSTVPQGCDVCVTGAIVSGRVMTAAGAPVAGARVAVDMRLPSCALSTAGWEGGAILSDAQGSYRLVAIAPVSPTSACVIVTATPPAGVSAAVTADSGHVVRLQDTYPATIPLDSIRVDLVLRPLQ